ncbi:unnamed protein product [Brassica oleracea var. botrytis]|uniref:(rape) hypothetical protein n=1 Tax=Brassica napus TaxID=3708 RepID=A0A816KWF9_BRANA|nr:unnamed protein product [Brassica napus]
MANSVLLLPNLKPAVVPISLRYSYIIPPKHYCR